MNGEREEKVLVAIANILRANVIATIVRSAQAHFCSELEVQGKFADSWRLRQKSGGNAFARFWKEIFIKKGCTWMVRLLI